MFKARNWLFVVMAVLMVFSVAALASAQGTATVQATNNATFGQILADGKGMTLYMYTKDTPGTSNCYDACATAWPPLTVAQGSQATAGQGVTGKLGTTTRKDNTLQVTYNDMPLYYWAKDTAAGQATGQDVGHVWYVINPASGPVKTNAQGTPVAAATAGPTAAAGATTAPTSGAAAAATTAPTAAATAAATTGAAATTSGAGAAGATATPKTLPTTGGQAVPFAAVVALAGLVLLLLGGASLTLARRTR